MKTIWQFMREEPLVSALCISVVIFLIVALWWICVACPSQRYAAACAKAHEGAKTVVINGDCYVMVSKIENTFVEKVAKPEAETASGN